MPRKTKKQIEADEDEAFARHYATVPLEMKVAVKRKHSLDRCRRFRHMMEHGSPAGYSYETIKEGLKNEQRFLVNVRRMRVTGHWGAH